MELTAKHKMRIAPRTPCKEVNFQFGSGLQGKNAAKPANVKNLSIQVSLKTSVDNSFSLSPMRPALPLYLVTPSNVSISTALQQRIKSRSKTRDSVKKEIKTPKSCFFSRNLEWKKDTDRKISVMQKEKDKVEMCECTFAPRIQGGSRLKSRKGSGKGSVCGVDERVVKEEVVRKNFDGIGLGEEEIERSFLRITNALDFISRQIVQTIEAEEGVN